MSDVTTEKRFVLVTPDGAVRVDLLGAPSALRRHAAEGELERLTIIGDVAGAPERLEAAARLTTEAGQAMLVLHGARRLFFGRPRRFLREARDFGPGGEPLRTRIELELEALSPAVELAPGSTTPRESAVLRVGETLSDFARRAAGDARAWRRIAKLNGIHDPLEPGAPRRLTLKG